jgi:AcrR family transcriptional regulator
MSRKSYHKGNVREGLIEAAEIVLQEEGLAALSLRRLAREIGVAPSAVYNHFSSREELLAAVAADGYRRMEALEKKFYGRGGEEPEKRLRLLVREYLRFAAEHPNLYRLMFSPDVVAYRVHPELNSAGDTSFKVSVEWWYGEGSYDSARSAIRYPYALAVWAMVHGAAMQMIDGLVTVSARRGETINALADVIADTLIDGVRPGLPKNT